MFANFRISLLMSLKKKAYIQTTFITFLAEFALNEKCVTKSCTQLLTFLEYFVSRLPCVANINKIFI